MTDNPTKSGDFAGPPPGKAGKSPALLRGRAWTFGANVDTDQIIPAKYAIYSLDEKKLGEHAMEGVPGNDGGWSQKISAGDILVAGSNFGCGSSREIAPIALRGAGISVVVADSFARIFFRNSINLGFPILQSPQAAEAVKEGDELEIDLDAGVIRNFTQGDEYRCESFPDFMNELIKMGGLVPWVRKQLEERRQKAHAGGVAGEGLRPAATRGETPHT
jgi:3-isopropylmalate/(R)-2-methylmalate dehydratase small subunit